MIGKKAGPQRGKAAIPAAKKKKPPARLFAKGGGCIGRRGAPEVLCITGGAGGAVRNREGGAASRKACVAVCCGALREFGGAFLPARAGKGQAEQHAGREEQGRCVGQQGGIHREKEGGASHGRNPVGQKEEEQRGGARNA